ncbi:MAG: hypothetical protein H9W82_00355, partial [Lactobacillus sp.]|nr:hypothetical protein [Lactobacillus sp.]
MKKEIVMMFSTVLAVATVGVASCHVSAAEMDYDTSLQTTDSCYLYYMSPDVQHALNKVLGREKNQPFTTKQLENLTGTLDLSNQNISDLRGLEYCKNVTGLDLSNNYLRTGFNSTTSVLKKMPQLKYLNLEGNSITDLHDLKNLVNLENVNISNQSYFEKSGFNKDNHFYMENPLKDVNNQTIDITNDDIYVRDGFNKENYSINYDNTTKELTWNYDPFDQQCFAKNPCQPFVVFNKTISIGKTTTNFNGYWFKTLDSSKWAEDLMKNRQDATVL